MIERTMYILTLYGEDEGGGLFGHSYCFGSKEECKKYFDEQVELLEGNIVDGYEDITMEQVHNIGLGKAEDEYERFGYSIAEQCAEWYDWEDTPAREIIKWEEVIVKLPEENKIWKI